MIGIDFADPARGICGTLRSGAAVIFNGREVLAAEPQPESDLSMQNGLLRANLSLAGVELSLEIAELGEPLLLADAGGAEELTSCRVLGDVRRGSSRWRLACLGVRSQGQGPDIEPGGLHRSLAVSFEDGGLLALEASRPRGAAGHGEEEVSAALTGEAGEPIQISRAHLSTQYDAEGHPRRATVELWPTDEAEPPLRAGAAFICGTRLGLGDVRMDVAFFRVSMGGREGTGRYEILSAA